MINTNFIPMMIILIGIIYLMIIIIKDIIAYSERPRFSEKAKFETWIKDQGFNTNRTIHKEYANSKVNLAWEAWKEAIREYDYE